MGLTMATRSNILEVDINVGVDVDVAGGFNVDNISIVDGLSDSIHDGNAPCRCRCRCVYFTSPILHHKQCCTGIQGHRVGLHVGGAFHADGRTNHSRAW